MKKALRKEYLKRRRNLSAAEVSKSSSEIVSKLKNLEEIREAAQFHVYYPINNEVDIRGFIEWLWRENKKVIMPRTNFQSKELENYYVISFGQLEERKFGLHEPRRNSPLHLGSPEIVLVPGVLFGEDLSRMGYGGGFYDRYLSDIEAIKIGISYEMQVLKELPVEVHDQLMDVIVTEKRIIKKV